jgi:hypothetical protein
MSKRLFLALFILSCSCVFANLIAAVPMSSDYDSDESTGYAALQLDVTIPMPPVSNDPVFELGKNNTCFLIVDHTANQRHGLKISDIWFHGGERQYGSILALRPLHNPKDFKSIYSDTIKGSQEFIQLSGAYATRQTSWRRKEGKK